MQWRIRTRSAKTKCVGSLHERAVAETAKSAARMEQREPGCLWIVECADVRRTPLPRGSESVQLSRRGQAQVARVAAALARAGTAERRFVHEVRCSPLPRAILTARALRASLVRDVACVAHEELREYPVENEGNARESVQDLRRHFPEVDFRGLAEDDPLCATNDAPDWRAREMAALLLEESREANLLVVTHHNLAQLLLRSLERLASTRCTRLSKGGRVDTRVEWEAQLECSVVI